MSAANPLRWYWSYGDDEAAHGPHDTREAAEVELRAELAFYGDNGPGEGSVFQLAEASWMDYLAPDRLLEILDAETADDRHENSRLTDIPRPILEHAAAALSSALAGWAPDWHLRRGEFHKITLEHPAGEARP